MCAQWAAPYQKRRALRGPFSCGPLVIGCATLGEKSNDIIGAPARLAATAAKRTDHTCHRSLAAYAPATYGKSCPRNRFVSQQWLQLCCHCCEAADADRIHPSGRGGSLEKTPVCTCSRRSAFLDCRVGGGKTRLVRWDLEPNGRPHSWSSVYDAVRCTAV